MRILDPIEQEVNNIRLLINEKTKNMTPEQLTDFYRKSGEASAKKYGFVIVADAKGIENAGITGE